MFLIIFPFSSKLVSIHIPIETFTFPFAHLDVALVKLILSKSDKSLPFYLVWPKITLVLD